MNLNKLFSQNLLQKINLSEAAKLPLIVSILMIAASIYFLYSIFNVYQNLDIHAASKARYENLLNEKSLLKKNHALLFKSNAAYFYDLEHAPKTKSELASGIAKLIADNKLKLVKLSANEIGAVGNKNASLSIEADGSYEAIKHFTKGLHQLIAASEIQSLKLAKLKENGLLHATLNLKFSTPPQIKSFNDYYANSHDVTLVGQSMFSGWKMMPVGFVQVDPNTNNSEATTQNEVSTKKDPFQPPQVPSEAKPPLSSDVKNQDQKSGAYYLSGIMSGKNTGLCVITLPSGLSKVFAVGDKVNAKMVVKKITASHIMVNSTRQPLVQVGEEIF
jgi:Tfp pilus assembly protein PilO